MKLNPRQRLYLFACLIMVTGCTPGMKQSWVDIKAYYNTFYNARQYFNSALDTERQSIAELNPERPIRLHRSPSGSGVNAFDDAINSATEIITDHSDSRYYWRAYLMIGRSHFYSENYFTALETFISIYNRADDPDVKVSAAIWEGRSYLEMGVFEDGIQLMNDKIYSAEISESDAISSLKLVLADLYVDSFDYDSAIELLLEALPQSKDLELKARGYFLLGQLFQQNGSGYEAIEAYNGVLENRPGFEMEYESRRKIGEVYRQSDSYDFALNQFQIMAREDKFRNRFAEIQYEIARTEHLRGNLPTAQTIYQDVLHNSLNRPDAVTLAKTYYSIGEVYENIYRDLSLAAAYYDSSSSQQIDSEYLPVDWHPDIKARAFGDYTRISNELAYRDSILTIGMMAEDEREAYLTQIIENTQQVESESPAEQNQNRSSLDQYEDIVPLVSEYGFLNTNNQVLLSSESLEFRSLWGERPLVDNWRRREVVSGFRVNQEEISDNRESESEVVDSEVTERTISDLREDLPVTLLEQTEIREQIHELYFQLANVYLQNLQNSDSASVYFSKVIESDYADHLKAQALYGLADIAFSSGDTIAATERTSQLISGYPQHEVTRLAMQRMGMTTSMDTSDEDSLQTIYSDIVSNDSHPVTKANNLNDLANQFIDDNRSAQILLDSAYEYLSSYNIGSDFHELSIDSTQSVLLKLELRYPDSQANTRANLLREELINMTSDSLEIDSIEFERAEFNSVEIDSVENETVSSPATGPESDEIAD